MSETNLAAPISQASPPALRRLALRRLALRRLRVARQLCVGVGLLLGAWWLGDILVGANFHTVIPGRVYRAAQPTAASLERMVREYGIRTIVNLRGTCNPLPWYLEEAGAVQRLGISEEDISFSAIHLPSASELRELVAVLDRCEYPILLHCRHGSDRTGLAAALVLLMQTSSPYAQARRELGLYYGHLAYGKTGWLDQFFDLYEEWLAETGREHSPENVRHWVLEEYRGGRCAGGVEEVVSLGAPKADRPIAFRVMLRNRSQAVWHFKPTITAGIHVSYRVWDGAGHGVAEGRAGFRDATVAPGERFPVTMVLNPLPAGQYRIVVDLVEEFHCWFSQVGSEPWEQEFFVRE